MSTYIHLWTCRCTHIYIYIHSNVFRVERSWLHASGTLPWIRALPAATEEPAALGTWHCLGQLHTNGSQKSPNGSQVLVASLKMGSFHSLSHKILHGSARGAFWETTDLQPETLDASIRASKHEPPNWGPLSSSFQAQSPGKSNTVGAKALPMF